MSLVDIRLLLMMKNTLLSELSKSMIEKLKDC